MGNSDTSNYLYLLGAGTAIGASLFFSNKYISQYYKNKKVPPVESKKKGKYHTDPNAPPPEPTPLYITPEQVKTRDDRPWRPFRWPYHQTMSIFKLDINHWLDMDKYYYDYIKEKERVYHSYGKDNIDWLPGSEDACLELMEIVKSHMMKRYPLLFTTEDDGVHVMNEMTQELLDFSLPLKDHPLIYVSKMAKEDFYIVLKGDDGVHRLMAAAVPFPGGSFGIKYKLGKTLDVIHTEVPYYETKLKPSMERWFAKMAPADLVERASWYISWDHRLLLNTVYALKEDETVESSIPPTEFNVRVERQTLRRLPKSKAIIFTNHPVFYSIEEMKDEPLVPSLIRKIIYEAPEGICKYKNFHSFRDHILPYLDQLVQNQIDNGLITEDTPVKTLPTYPFAHFLKNSDAERGWANPKGEINYSETLRKEFKEGVDMEVSTYKRVGEGIDPFAV